MIVVIASDIKCVIPEKRVFTGVPEYDSLLTMSLYLLSTASSIDTIHRQSAACATLLFLRRIHNPFFVSVDKSQ